MMKRVGLAILICAVILTGCNNSKPENIDTEVNTIIPNLPGEFKGLQGEGKAIPKIDLNTEQGIKEYLVGEWVFDKEYMSDGVCNMSIDYDLNIQLSFQGKYVDDFKGDYVGKIILDRLYANIDEAPDLISIELTDTDLPGGDFLFLHRSIYDEKNVMSLFFAGNGNSIFDIYLCEEESDYAPSEIIFERESGITSQLSPHKNDSFYAIFWGKGVDGKSLWLDDVLLTPTDEYDSDPKYPYKMTYYENDVKESIRYRIHSDSFKDILGDDLYAGQIYFMQTDENGDIIGFENVEDNEYTGMVDDPDNYGYALFQNSDIGTSKIIKRMQDIELIKESGPFTIKITDVQVLDFILFAEYKESFSNKDKLTIITITLEVENSSTENNWINPLGTIVTNTKEEAEVDYMLSDSLGGEYTGNNVEKGTILFMLDSVSEDIKKITYFVEGAKDENFDLIGEDIEFEIEF